MTNVARALASLLAALSLLSALAVGAVHADGALDRPDAADQAVTAHAHPHVSTLDGALD